MWYLRKKAWLTWFSQIVGFLSKKMTKNFLFKKKTHPCFVISFRLTDVPCLHFIEHKICLRLSPKVQLVARHLSRTTRYVWTCSFTSSTCNEWMNECNTGQNGGHVWLTLCLAAIESFKLPWNKSDCSAWMWYTEGFQNPLPEGIVEAFPDAFYGLFTRWIHEIDPKDLGNDPSGVTGDLNASL